MWLSDVILLKKKIEMVGVIGGEIKLGDILLKKVECGLKECKRNNIVIVGPCQKCKYSN